MDLELVKSYLKVDTDDEDTEIQLMIDAAKEHLKASIDNFNSESPKQQLMMLKFVTSIYEERKLSNEKSNGDLSYESKSMNLQSQLD